MQTKVVHVHDKLLEKIGEQTVKLSTDRQQVSLPEWGQKEKRTSFSLIL